ncbi:MAG: hypothetical protein C0507_23490 [Cyanobacteria bacterium PR.3.49]|nr:hypothetical protein [Cyanobacteria bacterium PR.3.49]
MNWAIVKNTWQMCLNSKLRQLVIVLMVFWPLVKTTAELCITNEFPNEYLEAANNSVVFVLACGSGCIGGQLNDGTLSLVLSRPVKISSYAFSKWFAVAVAASVASLTQFAGEMIVVACRTPYMIDGGFVLTNFFERLMICFAFSAVFMFFSSLVSGSKDLAVYFVSFIIYKASEMIAQIRPETFDEGLGKTLATLFVPPIAVVDQALGFVLAPKIDLAPLLVNSVITWPAVTAYFTVLAVFVSVCIYSLNRRELPYGAD